MIRGLPKSLHTQITHTKHRQMTCAVCKMQTQQTRILRVKLYHNERLTSKRFAISSNVVQFSVSGCHRSPVRLSRAIETLKILLGNPNFKLPCPNGQSKSKQASECELKFFVIICDISADVYNNLFQNRLKVTPLTSFVCSMSLREGVLKFYKQFFNNSKCWVHKSGTIEQIDLHCQVAPWGYLQCLIIWKSLEWVQGHCNQSTCNCSV